ncbi:Cu-Zn family superoxide dismutase [Sphingomonas zeicaulis]|uniref:superoxide dismutase family protein n=1 Tax=Sphingomonas zeicaulis TaxID=1632740 RepID=UPI003D2262C6
MRLTMSVAAATLFLLGGCATTGTTSDGTEPKGTRAFASLFDGQGAPRGEASVTPTADGVRLAISGMDLPPGAHGFHIHTVGRCDGPDFTTAGGHWNPTNHQHGRDNPQGAHMGDLPNLMIGTDGRGTLEIDIPGASLSGGTNPLLDADGAALVIHAGPDDMKSDPAGNSGGRIACGVFAAS